MKLALPGGPQAFLSEYWQKKPCLIKGGIMQFKDPLDANDLAGLAMEAEVESRLVVRMGENWDVQHGPFESFPSSDKDWTLLVQAVDHWFEQSNELMQLFDFMPGWRVDDLMVSFSVPGGGVGPHLDQYDVFIIQGEGKRRWRVGDKQPLKTLTPHPSLLQVEPFKEALIDVEMEPGDILYIPPGFPHEGYAVTAALNYSVGFRAPSGRDLLTHFADLAIDEERYNHRYGDPDLRVRDKRGEVSLPELNRLKRCLTEIFDDEATLYRFFGLYLSEAKHELDLAPCEPEYHEEEVAQLLEAGTVLHRLAGTRALYLAGVADCLFVDGEAHALPQAVAEELANQGCPDTGLLAAHPAALRPLTRLINRGYWFFEE
ncbi:cupin domain-containing protein [Gallaecimonas kandeliae]|uniref:cupin domain-containing protein n=1 Tax=Gallaecimonas kandeliae TaxID=3029055 RepID=UPI00264A0FA1|nr:cupin domain-containing protein [Gallaecimonas kandeliae]WKE67239.1 cupin domain-containing protein [Gallaecimonas kandeliae]